MYTNTWYRLDNSPCKNFFSHLKNERLELEIPLDENDLISVIDHKKIKRNDSSEI